MGFSEPYHVSKARAAVTELGLGKEAGLRVAGSTGNPKVVLVTNSQGYCCVA